MGHKQGLENLLHAAALVEDPEVRIVLAGDGNERAKLDALAADLRLTNVSFLPPQPTGLYESMLRAADVLLVNQRAAVGEMSLASKLTSYFMAARPVLAAVNERSETAREIEKAGAGLLVAPDDPAALAEALVRFKHSGGQANALGSRGRAYAEKYLSTASVLGRYEEFVHTVSRGSAPRLRPFGAGPWDVSDPSPEVHDAREARTDPQVSVLIVSYNCRATLTSCLTSLAADETAPPLEVIVVDNASEDGTVAAIEERFPWVHIIANHANVGFARAMNEGLESARGEVVLALNPDTVVPAGAISKSVAELERHPDVGMLGVKLVRPDGTFDHACKRGFPTVSSALFYFLGLSRLRPHSARFAQYTAGQLDEDESGTVDAINGAFMLVKREAVAQVGPMDERYWLYAEDIDWCRRFWDSGWKVLYWPGVHVIHRKGGSSGDIRSWDLNRAFHRSMWLFYGKHVAPDQPAVVAGFVWAGIWTKLGLSALANALRRPPTHDWDERAANKSSGADRRG
jgi:GT2 family glycosyltransferase